MADGVTTPIPDSTGVATETYEGGTRQDGKHRQEVVLAIAGAAASPTTAGITTSSAEVIAASGTRHSYVLTNDTDTDVWLAFGAAAVVGSGIPLRSGGGRITVGPEYAQFQLRAIHGGSGTKTISVQVFDA